MAADSPFAVTIDPALASVVRPLAFTIEPVVVREQEPRLDRVLRSATEGMRQRPEPLGVVAAVRAMYRAVGLDPTKTRPSSEALLRRVRKGGELPRINSLVDVINWCSLESQLPFGLYDADRIAGAVTLRLGREGESYAGIRKDTVHLADRVTLADATGPFGNPTSDSARTMVTPQTARAVVVIFAPSAVDGTHVERAAAMTDERVRVYCAPDAA